MMLIIEGLLHNPNKDYVSCPEVCAQAPAGGCWHLRIQMAPWWQVWAIQTCRQTAHHRRHPPRALEQTWAAALPMQVQQTPPAVGVPHQLSGMGKPAGPPVLMQQNPRRQLSAGTMPQWQPISSLPPRRIRCQPLRATSPWRQPPTNLISSSGWQVSTASLQ